MTTWTPPPKQPRLLWNTDENNPAVQARIGKSEQDTYMRMSNDKEYAREVWKLRNLLADNL